MGFKVTLEASRIMLGLSLEEAAKLFEVHPQTLARWEKNPENMKQKDVKKIVEVYGIPASNIFFGDKNEFIRLKQKNELFSIK